MSSDPYLAFKSEIDSTLSQTHSLLSSYLRLLSSPNRSLIDEAHQELLQTLAILEADLEDLEESVLAVEGGQGWGIAEVEVKRRRRDLERVRGEIERIRQQASSQPSSHPSSSSSPHTSTPPRLSTSSSTKGKGRADTFQDIPLAEVGGARAGNGNGRGRYRDDLAQLDHEEAKRKRDSEDLNEWEEMEQKQIIQSQDTILHSLSGTLTNIASMAGLIGSEVHEQNEMLDDLSTRVDATDGRLTRANKRLREFVRKNEEKASSWCILILIVVLCVLLLLVIIT